MHQIGYLYFYHEWEVVISVVVLQPRLLSTFVVYSLHGRLSFFLFLSIIQYKCSWKII